MKDERFAGTSGGHTMGKLSSQIFVALSLSMGAWQAFAQSTDQMNAANNPLQPSIGLNLQDDYTGS